MRELLLVATLMLAGCGASATGDDKQQDRDLDNDGVNVGEDCNDSDAAVHPGAEEVAYDGIVQDCDSADLADVDGDGHDARATGGQDCNDDDASVHPGADDVCGDGIDQDCGGSDLDC